MRKLLHEISEDIQDSTGKRFPLASHRPLSGGCINRAELLEGDGQRYFVKINRSSSAGMFEAEVEGLRVIQASGALRVPAPVCWGVRRDSAYLVLEYIELAKTAGAKTHAEVGRGLAKLHRTTGDGFGWHRDNTIGATPQVNTWMDGWAEFFAEHRLGCQLRMAADNGVGRETLLAGERLLVRLNGFFTDYTPVPSLLHGDLWAGNFSADLTGEAVVFDPAPYFGDRETDLAMTELFGGFDRAFYDAYSSLWALDAGYGTRKTLYNLYHVLNHFNLFGGGYGSQARSMIHQLLAALG